MRSITSILSAELWRTALLVVLFAGASIPASADQTITLRSGNGAIGSQDGLVRVTATANGATGDFTPTAAQFTAVQTAPFAYVVNPASVYLASLPDDPLARWIARGPGSPDGSVLYAVPFTLTDTAISSASLALYFSVDNAINGVFLNGSPISGNSYDGDYHAEYEFVRYDIAPLLRPNTTNWLYLNVSDYGEVSALMFSATITTQAVSAALSISPNSGGNAGTVTATIGGVGGLPSGTTVTLSATGQTSITATAVSFVNPTTLTATFDLTGAHPGTYDVVLTPPTGSPQTLSKGFSVVEGGASQIWVDVVGPPNMRINRQQTFYVLYGNTGNVDAIGVPLWITGVPTDASLHLGFTVLPPAPLVQGVDYSQIPDYFNTGSDIEAGFLIPLVPAGSTVALQIVLTIPEAEDFQLRVFADPPWFGSSAEDSAAANLVPGAILPELEWSLDAFATGDLSRCGSGIIGGLFQLTGVPGCYKSVLGFYRTYLLQLYAPGTGTPNLVNLPLAILNLANQCVASPLVCDACAGGQLEACVACEQLQLSANATKVFSNYNTLKACKNVANSIFSAILKIIGVGSTDPNDKIGSQGVGKPQFLLGQQPLRYAIDFGNEDTASAPAQQVVIMDQLDTTNDNLETLSLGPINFGSISLNPLPLQRSYATTVDLRPTTNLLVSVSASLAVSKGLLSWSFQSLDPTTLQPPTDPTIGFLPPGIGGSVSFTVLPSHGVATNTQIQNQATVKFDENAPLSTPTWLNTIDNTPPTSSVQALPSIEPDANFAVSWAGTDVGSGIQFYNIYASDNGADFAVWQQNTTATSASFTPQLGHTYGFYSIATDNVGNGEPAKASAEATTVVQDFTLTATNTTVNVAPGSAANYSLSLTGKGGFDQSVTFSCMGAPSGATCTASPNSATAGSSATTITVTATTTPSSVSAPGLWRIPPGSPFSRGVRSWWMLLVLLAAIGWAVVMREQTGAGRRKYTFTPLAAALLLTLALLACGGGGGSVVSPGPTKPPTPAGSYHLTVTGTYGSGASALSHSVTLTLNVS